MSSLHAFGPFSFSSIMLPTMTTKPRPHRFYLESIKLAIKGQANKKGVIPRGLSSSFFRGQRRNEMSLEMRHDIIWHFFHAGFPGRGRSASFGKMIGYFSVSPSSSYVYSYQAGVEERTEYNKSLSNALPCA